MYILGVHTGHDAAACLFHYDQLVAFCKEERLSRVKNDGQRFELASVDEVLRIANITRQDLHTVVFSKALWPLDCYKKTSRPVKKVWRQLRNAKRYPWLISEMEALQTQDTHSLVDIEKSRQALGLSAHTHLTFCNHHYAHILGAYHFTDWQKDALYVSCDGGGDDAQYSAYYFDGQQLECLLGGEETLFSPQNLAASIGQAYSKVTEMCGFTPLKHEGKITGLAAFGQPLAAQAIAENFSVSEDGHIHSPLNGKLALESFLTELLAPLSREDKAASIQQATETVVLQWIETLLARTNAKYVGLSGGVFANVLLNQKVAALNGVEEIYVFPAMGDEGLPVGQCVDVVMKTEGIEHRRQRLTHPYLGFPYGDEALLEQARTDGFQVETPTDIATTVAQRLAQGEVGAVYNGAMEMGPRALGARSIIASPAQRDINDTLNQRLDRTEFMPFAPYVLDTQLSEVFEVDKKTREACRFMTVTASVNPKYRDSIPAVVHVDGTARPQVIDKDEPKTRLYYDILEAFTAETGMPCLVNTSFNAHEEPIINTPAEALRALADHRVDFLVCPSGIILPTD